MYFHIFLCSCLCTLHKTCNTPFPSGIPKVAQLWKSLRSSVPMPFFNTKMVGRLTSGSIPPLLVVARLLLFLSLIWIEFFFSLISTLNWAKLLSRLLRYILVKRDFALCRHSHIRQQTFRFLLFLLFP